MPEQTQNTSAVSKSPTKHSSPNSFLREQFLIVVTCIFIGLLAAYVYNEVSTPLYVASTTLKLNSNSYQNLSHLNFYQYQQRLRHYISELQSRGVTSKLAEDPAVQYIVKVEQEYLQTQINAEHVANPAPIVHEINMTELIQRIDDALSLDINPENSLIEVEARDPNPKLAVTLTNLLLPKYQEVQNPIDLGVEDLIKSIRSSLAQSISDATLNDESKTPTLPSKDTNTSVATLTKQKLELVRVLRELQYILEGTQVHLPLALSETKLSQMLSKILSLEFELQQAGAAADKSKLASLGFLKADFSLEIRKTMQKLHQQLRDINSRIFASTDSNTNSSDSIEMANREFETFTLINNGTKIPELGETLLMLDRAVEPSRPRTPAKLINLTIGGSLGLIVGFGLSIIFIRQRRSILSEHDINKFLHLHVLETVSMPKVDIPPQPKENRT